MTEFTSDIKTIPYSDERIFAMLSDLNNLERVKDRVPNDKIKDFTFDRDSCSMEINPVGKVVFTVISREPNKTVKFEASNLPVPLNLWIQLKPAGAEVTKMKMTVRTDVNPFLKPMISKPLQDALDKISDIIASLPYDEQV
ncbi:MAG: SRPBCC family protein [Tannerella sp.]|jgi:carbon monoxide dehydrogenase subunit G|nr:SRPBCC family protein [Tannerella sp.]